MSGTGKIVPYIEDGQIKWLMYEDVDDRPRLVSRYSGEPRVDPDDKRKVIVLCIIAAIAGLIVGWVSAPFGWVPI